MNYKYLVCDDCLDFLARESTDLIRIWFSLCDDWVETKKPRALPYLEYLHLPFLEKHGYITTHEDKDKLLIRVEGFYHDDDDGEDFFCVNLDKHFPIENIGEI